MRRAYSGVRFKTYVEFQENNSILIGHTKTLLGNGDVTGNLITGIDPNDIQTYIGRAVNLELSEYIFESRRIEQNLEDKLTGNIKSVTANGGNFDIEGNGTLFSTELSLNEYIRINGNLLTYLEVITITDDTHITVSGSSWLGLANRTIYKYTGTQVSKDFRDDHTATDIYIHAHTNNFGGLLQYDEFGNFLTTDRVGIDSCQEFYNIEYGKGLLIHNEEKTKGCIIYGTFDSIIDTNYESLGSNNFEGGYVIGENEPIYYKLNAFRVRDSFSQTNQLVVSELASNKIYEVQLNGRKVQEGIDYTVNYSSRTITFLGNYLSDFNNTVSILVYGNNQDVVASGCKIRLTIKGYDETQILSDYQDYLDNLDYCYTFIDPSPNPSYTNKVIETLDRKLDREIVVSANNRLSFKQTSIYDDSENSIIEEPLYSYVQGRGIYFRLVRIDDNEERLEYYNDCVFYDPIQKSTTAGSEDYNITLKYKDRKEFQIQSAGDNIASKNNSYLLISEN